jgi:uncharacterized protein YggE
MKKIHTSLNTSLVLVILLALVAVGRPDLNVRAAAPGEAAAKPETICDTGRSINVSGTAVVNVVPDRVLIQLGVQSNGSTPNQVESYNSATISRVVRALKREGVDEKDIVTDRYVIQPIYKNYDALTIKGYRIYNVVAITLRDISTVNDVIIAALGAGANQVINVEFYLSDLRKYRDQARELAMIAAKEKADDLASAAGSKTGCVMNINENTWSYFNSYWYSHQQDLWTQNVMQNAAPAGDTGALADGGPVNLGQISVRAEVSATFSLK